ncbi:DNA mismatch repair protein PMS1 [Cordyceps militaris CM01]|uniref:DNA mismatch repair protein PMS1 n=1 Tax=Cordyceps militaris (strain CM01) TaxID=983644 RepID=G3JCQ2_CORMM|nr:DNA mismatch repair protein PMS1 [Cordyceps militaris CM01]EGX94660.1 DNA mismatch repair protein PMS1 [Cordyceps militaris CM01]
MATIKQIDGRSIHQIQSGQVIVDLCSVVKELVENSVDAGATTLDVRFKNQGLDSIEIQDNGSGISPANYESVALKHHTSKLETYSDIASLHTFGFRGEALASLCALSTVTITTCLAQDAPKGTKLTFEASGKLQSTSIIAAQRGTTVAVEKLFHNLPVRRRELERNIKREWHKVIALLNQYACILTQLKFSVSQQPTKGKRILLFSTKGNQTTKDNIINIFGAKTMTALVALDLKLEIVPTTSTLHLTSTEAEASKQVCVLGHVSRPVHGEGRQTPDRQMFFVNGRPCGLPQFAKTFNEIYKSYNYSQSPFIFADIRLDTNMYDVNVSPDKRSILLHDQNHLLESLRSALVELFDQHDYTVPVAQAFSTLGRSATHENLSPAPTRASKRQKQPEEPDVSDTPLEDDHSQSSDEDTATANPTRTPIVSTHSTGAQSLISRWASNSASSPAAKIQVATPQTSISARFNKPSDEVPNSVKAIRVRDFNERLAENAPIPLAEEGVSAQLHSTSPDASPEPPIPATQPMRLVDDTPRTRIPRSLKRDLTETITVTIGNSPQRNIILSPSKRRKTESIASEDDDEAMLSDDQDTRQNLSVERDDEDLAQQLEEEEEWSEPEPEPMAKPQLELEVEEEDIEAQSSEKESGASTPVHAAEEDSDGDFDEAKAANNEEDEDEDGAPEKATSATELKRNTLLQPTSRRKDTTLILLQRLKITPELLRAHVDSYRANALRISTATTNIDSVEDISATDAESRLQLIISKGDFGKMRVAGQFNLGFIIAVRPRTSQSPTTGDGASNDELFIIDQHASDEKYNFERLQSSTVVQSQRLVHPKTLDLTALEEEIVMENQAAIEANGFQILVDTSGDAPVGGRCTLTALPLSRETAFSLEDLEELIAILGDTPGGGDAQIPRPAKVRKMFAMRACRSSVMIGKPLTLRQMYGLVRHMGELDKPWNCPHGRPTMRHLCRLQAWDEHGWKGDVVPTSTARWQAFTQQEE